MASKKELLGRILFLLSVLALSFTLAIAIFIGLVKWWT
jgi:hypothetical protein